MLRSRTDGKRARGELQARSDPSLRHTVLRDRSRSRKDALSELFHTDLNSAAALFPGRVTSSDEDQRSSGRAGTPEHAPRQGPTFIPLCGSAECKALVTSPTRAPSHKSHRTSARFMATARLDHTRAGSKGTRAGRPIPRNGF